MEIEEAKASQKLKIKVNITEIIGLFNTNTHARTCVCVYKVKCILDVSTKDICWNFWERHFLWLRTEANVIQ